MDLNGFKAINQALESANLAATVTPTPQEGENVRFVTIETDESVQPARVLNVLGSAGLTYYDGPQDAVMSHTPELSPLGVQAGSLTFEDRNSTNRRSW